MSLSANYHAVEKIVQQLQTELEQTKRERDAAMEDLSAHRPCDACAYYEMQGNDCLRCQMYTERPCWKWRGVQEET